MGGMPCILLENNGVQKHAFVFYDLVLYQNLVSLSFEFGKIF